MRKLTEFLTYALLTVLALTALGLFEVLPRLSLVTALVYRGF